MSGDDADDLERDLLAFGEARKQRPDEGPEVARVRSIVEARLLGSARAGQADSSTTRSTPAGWRAIVRKLRAWRSR